MKTDFQIKMERIGMSIGVAAGYWSVTESTVKKWRSGASIPPRSIQTDLDQMVVEQDRILDLVLGGVQDAIADGKGKLKVDVLFGVDYPLPNDPGVWRTLAVAAECRLVGRVDLVALNYIVQDHGRDRRTFVLEAYPRQTSRRVLSQAEIDRIIGW